MITLKDWNHQESLKLFNVNVISTHTLYFSAFVLQTRITIVLLVSMHSDTLCIGASLNIHSVLGCFLGKMHNPRNKWCDLQKNVSWIPLGGKFRRKCLINSMEFTKYQSSLNYNNTGNKENYVSSDVYRAVKPKPLWLPSNGH